MTRRAVPADVNELLTGEQLVDVADALATNGGIRSAFAGLGGDAAICTTWPKLAKDRGLSRSLLAGLLVLLAFPEDGSYLGNSDIGRLLGMSLPTSHRYIRTLATIGLLQRDPITRKYRRM
jgi:hypothetical protein